jgi:predicted secreted protein
MTVGSGMLGRDMLLTVAGQPIAGVTSKGVSINNEPVDVSSDDSTGFREILAQAGMSTVDISLSGITKNMELMRSCMTNESKVYALLITYTDGSTLALDGFLNTYSTTGEHAGAETFDAAFQSTGEPTFTAGVV